MSFHLHANLKTIVVFTALVLIGARAAATSGQYILKESFTPSNQWVRQGRAQADHKITLKISLTQPRFQELEQQLYAVSDPDSALYGQHLSKNKVYELAAPSTEGLKTVNDWLSSEGFDVQSLARSPSNDSIKVETTIQKAEAMLNTSYYVWKYAPTGGLTVRTTNWSVPESLSDYIDLIHPTTMFPPLGRPQAGIIHLSPNADPDPNRFPVASIPSLNPLPVDPRCNKTVTPTCLFELYNATQYKVQEPERSKIAISSYLEQFANLADLQQFYGLLRPEALNSSFKVFSVRDGQNNQTRSEAGSEADLDVQYAFGLTSPMKSVVYTTGGSPPFIPDTLTPNDTNEPYLDIKFVLSQDDLPQTISTSYGDIEETVPFSYARKVCAGFAQLGARGVSLIFASGDSGVGDGNPNPANTTCKMHDGQIKFLPNFPPTCPYITIIGATTDIPEVATTNFGSGGGFSNYFPRPAYQDSAVLPFLKALGNTYHGMYNPKGRAYPDAAALGDLYVVVINGTLFSIGGTSAASPAFAGIVALLNDARLAAGKSPLGFLNPFLYKKGFKALNDITVGSNPGCGTQGFNCTVGWDPVTGLGSPNFGLLKELVLPDHKH